MAAETGTNFFNLESASNFANLFLVFVIGSAVPVLTWVLKKKESERVRHRKEEDERIIRTIREYTDPLSERLKKLEETNTAILTTLTALKTKFDEFSEEQKEVNAKVNYIDKIFQDNIKFGTRRPSSGRNS